MAQYEPIDSGVEVNGQTVLAVVNAFPDALKPRAMRILSEAGIEDPAEGEWYSQQAWLEAFSSIHDSIGESTVEKIGRTIPESGEWPPGTNTIVDAIEAIDTAYHMNHRGGEIGNYSVERIATDRLHVTCDNPYPCRFDIGILKAIVGEYRETRAKVQEIGTECRAEGGNKCLYEIQW